MIVEIFGPPAAGKTTLSRALAGRLRELGLDVDLVLSYRPAEVNRHCAANSRGSLELAKMVRRLGRPAVETLATARHLFGESPEAVIAEALLALMPPVSTIWSIRLRQYIWRLAYSWNRARASGRIVIFDQAFVQAVCSLGLLGAPKHANRLLLALDIVPRADFLIRLDAPHETLRARLQNRAHRQGVLERMLELDLDTNLRSIEIIGRVEQLLLERGAVMAGISSDDETSREAALQWLERAAVERFGAVAVSA
jgi:thymidylate kinase